MQDPASDQEEVSRLPLRSLGLKPGMTMQTRRLAQGARKQESQFFGAIEGKGVMVGAVVAEGEVSDLKTGDICLVRGFTGQYEYSFPSKVLQTFEKPFAYALLAYPNQVDAKLVRHSMRIKQTWPCLVSTPQADGSNSETAATLIDVSTSGAMIKTATSLAPVGAQLTLSMSVQVDDAPFELNLKVNVCHNNRASYEDAYFMGLVFQGATRQDKLVLTYIAQSH